MKRSKKDHIHTKKYHARPLHDGEFMEVYCDELKKRVQKDA